MSSSSDRVWAHLPPDGEKVEMRRSALRKYRGYVECEPPEQLEREKRRKVGVAPNDVKRPKRRHRRPVGRPDAPTQPKSPPRLKRATDSEPSATQPGHPAANPEE